MVNWGTFQIGANPKALTVMNTWANSIIVRLYISDLPNGWTLTCTQNLTVLEYTQSTTYDLILLIPSTATSGTYGFNTTIYAEEFV